MRTSGGPFTDDIRGLMESGCNVMGLQLTFHDYYQQSGLSSTWVQHDTTCCLAKKRNHNDVCTPYCVQKTREVMIGVPQGSIRTCPFGYTDLVVPVISRGLLVGMLFAGSCWLREGKPEIPDLIVPPHADWLADRLVILGALSRQLAHLMEGDPQHAGHDRRSQILSFLEDHLEHGLSLGDLAADLCLSASRTSHVVQETFGCSFRGLANRLRIQRAIALLLSTDLPVSLIAGQAGFDDPNYFSYLFRKHMKQSPRAYRKEHNLTA